MKSKPFFLVFPLFMIGYMVIAVLANEPSVNEQPFDYFLAYAAQKPDSTSTPTPTTTPTATPTAMPTPTIIERGDLSPVHLVMDTFAAGEGHGWQFEIGVSEIVTVTAITADPADLILSLRDADQNLLYEQNNAPVGAAETIGSFTLPVSGTFKLEVTTADLNGAEYALMLLFSDSLNFIFRGLVEDGSIETTQLAAVSEHFWFFESVVGQVMTTTVVPDATTDVFLELYGPDATRVSPGFISVGGDGVEERYSHKIDQSGLYAIRVGEWNFNSGIYTLGLTMTTAPPNPKLFLPTILFY